MLKAKLRLNAFAFMGAFLGLLNTLLAWRLYGTTSNGDVWILAIVIIQTFSLLSQIGVEQFAVFSSNFHTLSKKGADKFDSECITWAVWFGCGFCILLKILLPVFIYIFAEGYGAKEKEGLSALCNAFLLQIFWGPAMYIWRQQLMLKGKGQLSVLSNNLYPIIQASVMAIGWATGHLDQLDLAIAISVISFLLSMCIIISAYGFKILLLKPSLRILMPFIKASMAMRLTHSVHNFLVTAILSNILSGGVQGTVSSFQYTKRIADGLASVSVGPHLSIYHANQNLAWANKDDRKFKANIWEYLFSTIPLFFVAVLCACISIYVAKTFNLINIEITGQTFQLLLCLALWQLVIALETIPIGILVMENSSKLLLLINSIFVINMLLIVQLIQKPYSSIFIAIICLICQIVSIAIATFLGIKSYKGKFYK